MNKLILYFKLLLKKLVIGNFFINVKKLNLNKVIFFSFIFLLNSCCLSMVDYESGFAFNRSGKEKPKNTEHLTFIHIPSKRIEIEKEMDIRDCTIYFLEGYRIKLVSFIIVPFIPLPLVIPAFIDVQNTKYKKCSKKSKTTTLIIEHKYPIPQDYNLKKNIYIKDENGLKIFPTKCSRTKDRFSELYISKIVFDINCRNLNNKKLVMKYFYSDKFFESDYLKFKKQMNFEYMFML